MIQFYTYLKKHNIKLSIDGEFIENVLPNNYDYHIYKKGKKKNTLRIFKTKNKKTVNINDKLSLYQIENKFEKSIKNDNEIVNMKDVI